MSCPDGQSWPPEQYMSAHSSSPPASAHICEQSLPCSQAVCAPPASSQSGQSPRQANPPILTKQLSEPEACVAFPIANHNTARIAKQTFRTALMLNLL